MIAAENHPVQLACRVLGVSESGFYEQRKRPPAERAIRHAMLTDHHIPAPAPGRREGTALRRVMNFPRAWDPFFKDAMSLAEVYHYATQHFDFHRQQLTLTKPD